MVAWYINVFFRSLTDLFEFIFTNLEMLIEDAKHVLDSYFLVVFRSGRSIFSVA